MDDSEKTNNIDKGFGKLPTDKPTYTMARDLPKEDENSSKYWNDMIDNEYEKQNVAGLADLAKTLSGKWFKSACMVEVLQSERDVMIQKFKRFLSNKENDAMDDIALYRTEREEFERQISEWQYPLPKEL